MHTSMHSYVRIYMSTFMHLYLHSCTSTLMYFYISTFAYLYVHAHVFCCISIVLIIFTHSYVLTFLHVYSFYIHTCTCCCISAFWHADFCISVFLHFCISAFVACTNLLPVPAASGRQPRQAAASCRSAVLYPKKHNALIFICIYAHIYISIYAYLHSGGGEAWLARIARWPCNLWGAAENYIGGTSSGGSISGRCGGFTSTLLPFASTMPAAARHGVDPVCHASCCSFTLMLMVFYLQGLSRNGYGVLFNISINLSVEMCLYLFKCGNVKI